MALGDAIDFERLEEYLSALAYGSRLELLNILRVPRGIQDIRVAPRRLRAGENPERAVARQTIQGHLDKLMDIGVVLCRDAPDKRGKEYLVNPQKLYQILEELRKVGTVTADAPVPTDETVDLAASRAAPQPRGPRFLLVHGLHEGKAFPLRREDLTEGRGWLIGRREGLSVSLDYDPYVSSENAEVVPAGDGFALRDLKGSKNGTHLNWRRLGSDERPVLASGDVVGVGRSLLVFRRD